MSKLPADAKRLPYNGKRIFIKFYTRARKYSDERGSINIAWRAVFRKYYCENNSWHAHDDANNYDTTTTTDDDTSTNDECVTTDDDENNNDKK